MDESIDNFIKDIPESSDNNVTMYFGNFNSFGGDINIDFNIFQKLIQKIQNTLKIKCNKCSKKTYQYRNMFLNIINNKEKIYTLEEEVYNSIKDKLCIVSKKIKIIQKENFPIISNYSDISDQQIKIFNYNDVNLSFVEIIKNNEKKYYYKIDFINNNKLVRKYCAELIKLLLQFTAS